MRTLESSPAFELVVHLKKNEPGKNSATDVNVRPKLGGNSVDEETKQKMP